MAIWQRYLAVMRTHKQTTERVTFVVLGCTTCDACDAA